MKTDKEEELLKVDGEEDAEDKHPIYGGANVMTEYDSLVEHWHLPLSMRSLQSHWAATAIGVYWDLAASAHLLAWNHSQSSLEDPLANGFIGISREAGGGCDGG